MSGTKNRLDTNCMSLDFNNCLISVSESSKVLGVILLSNLLINAFFTKNVKLATFIWETCATSKTVSHSKPK